jgi:EAL domain-containing protein (putative c-di-GMP-specific phosphodiesterase class I)
VPTLPIDLPPDILGVPIDVALVGAAVLILGAVIALAIIRVRRRRRHAALEERFAGEYERTVISSGSHRRAEADLRQRIEHRRSYEVRPLGPDDRASFRSRLRDLEAAFVDAPEGTTAAALDLVVEVATARGYPDADLERCLDDVSVDQPQFVADLRRELAEHGSTSSTERHRRVVVRARVLVDRLVSDGEGSDEPASWGLVREILDDRRFHVVFQPIHSLDDGRTIAAEALARFDVTPHRPPHVWFQHAAAVGLGADLELAVIAAAFDEAAKIPNDIAISVNVSPETLGDERLRDLFDRHPEKQVVLEITEHAIVEDYESVTRSLARLRSPQVRVAVDDTGAGISSLRHIVQLQPDVIKLDHSLAQNVLADPIRQALASSLVHFAHRIDALLIAEGIETAADLAGWQDLGAHAIQGDLFSPPRSLPIDTTSPRIVPRPHAFGTAGSDRDEQGQDASAPESRRIDLIERTEGSDEASTADPDEATSDRAVAADATAASRTDHGDGDDSR